MSQNDPFSHLPETLSSDIVFDEFAKIRRDLIRLPNHQEYNYYSLITKKASVVVLAADLQGNWILNEEYRHPVGKVLLGCPGGFLMDHETPLEGAQRELLEETGHHSDKFQLIGSAYPFPGISTLKTYFVYACDAKATTEPKLEVAEILRTTILPPSELLGQIASGRDIDGTLLTALGFYQIFLRC